MELMLRLLKRMVARMSKKIDGFGSKGRVNGAVVTALMQKVVWKNEKNYLLKSPPKSLDVGDLHLVPELEFLTLNMIGCRCYRANS